MTTEAAPMSGASSFGARARRSSTLIAGLCVLALIVIAAAAAPWLAPHSPTVQDLTGGLKPPSAEYWFGTDQLGRDVFSRVLYAARTDLTLAFVAALAPFVIGVTAGLISGYFGRKVDWVISRLVDTVIAFPFYIIVIAIAFALGAGPAGIIVAFALVGWVGYARVIRALTSSMRDQEYVRAARGLGLSHARVITRHVLPNVLPQALVLFMNEVLLIMVAIVTLGYLGLGIQPPTPDWGTMIADAQPFVTTKWWLAALPGLAIVVTGIGLSLTADGLGDALRVRDGAGAGAGAGASTAADQAAAATTNSSSGSRPHHTAPSVGSGHAHAPNSLHVPLEIANPGVDAADTEPLAPGAVLVRDLVIRVRGDNGDHGSPALVSEVSMDVEPGATLGIVGESGSGKSLTLRALLGLMPAGVAIVRGDARAGGRIGMVFQDPLTALDPLTRIGTQLGEAVDAAETVCRSGNIDGEVRGSSDPALRRSRASRAARARRSARVHELLRLVQLQDIQRIDRAYPHELSGGQRQRIVIAMALASNPDVLLCDEPTTALDVTVQREVLALLRELRRTQNLTLIFVSHDLAVVASMCERILVMRGGAEVESGATEQVLRTPVNAYTRALLLAVPGLPPLDERTENEISRELPRDATRARDTLTPAATSARARGTTARDVAVSYQRARDTICAISFEVPRGGALGIVGESGSGKTTLARALVGQLPLSHGRFLVNGAELPAHRSRTLLRQIQLVPQDPTSSLSPRMRVGDTLAEALMLRDRAVALDGARELLGRVQLDPDLAARYPHELSGGQKQRVAIARALAANPLVLVADEPTSALDVSVQADIIALLQSLREETGLTLVLISHDLAVVHEVCDAVLVMRDGRAVEVGGRGFFSAPRTQYGRELLRAVPRL